MAFLISDAFAEVTDAAAQTAHADGSFSFIMLIAIFALFYFMLIRPQNKRAKEHRELVSQVKAGDEVVTQSGILGKVSNVDEQYIKVNIADGLEITMQKQAVSSVLPKGTLKSL